MKHSKGRGRPPRVDRYANLSAASSGRLKLLDDNHRHLPWAKLVTMTENESHQQRVARIIREVREVASQIPFDERAGLIREVAHEVRDAVKFDMTVGGAPEGSEWERDGLGKVDAAAEDYYHAALKAKQSREH